MRGFQRKIQYLLILAFLLLVICESLTRMYWVVRHDLGFFDMGRINALFYPSVDQSPPLDPKVHNILVLGGSVVSREWNPVFGGLSGRLEEKWGHPVNVAHWAQVSHSSLDSLVKYTAMEGQPFDTVFIYHGINDLRANNCPPEVYRDDYSHMVWYEQVNLCVAYPWKNWCVLPFTLHYFKVIVEGKLRSAPKLPSSGFPESGPLASWIQFGSDIKTRVAFRRNIQSIVEKAGLRGQRVVLATFKTYFSPGYTREKFDRHALDYADYKCPIETWGLPGNIRKGMEVHNAILRDVAKAYPHVTLVDMDLLMPSQGEFFMDVCHLSPKGQEVFLTLLLEHWPAAKALKP
ncbi:MAG: hypothetical protein AB7F75_01500 [Planctomycetota bacterium]